MADDVPNPEGGHHAIEHPLGQAQGISRSNGRFGDYRTFPTLPLVGGLEDHPTIVTLHDGHVRVEVDGRVEHNAAVELAEGSDVCPTASQAKTERRARPDNDVSHAAI
jgi:hypothetical protein